MPQPTLLKKNLLVYVAFLFFCSSFFYFPQKILAFDVLDPLIDTSLIEQPAAAKQVKQKRKEEKPDSQKNILGFTPEEEAKLNPSQKLARGYRQQGLQLQQIGNLQGAMSFYQKAIALDPFYPVVYNDLGIVYENLGMDQEAEKSYRRAVEIDSGYLSAYSNLALFYERKRDLDKAAENWAKRAELGMPDDPWTIKANQRVFDIRMVTGNNINPEELQTLGLVRETMDRKELLRKSDSALSKDYLEKAQLYYDRGEDLKALKEAVNAQQIDSENSEISEFVDKIQRRLLTK